MSYSETEGWGGMKQGGYTVFSLQTGYVIDQHWHAMLTINNLFDKYYYRQINAPSGFNYFGKPRVHMLNVRYKF